MNGRGQRSDIRPRLSLTRTRVSVIRPHERTESTASTLSMTQEFYGLNGGQSARWEMAEPSTSMKAGATAGDSNIAFGQARQNGRKEDSLVSPGRDHFYDTGAAGLPANVPDMPSAQSTLRGTASSTWQPGISQELLVGSSKSERGAQALTSAQTAQEERLLKHNWRPRPLVAIEGSPAATERSLPPLPTVTIPLQPVISVSGRQVRNYELQHGSNRFMLKGWILSSKDNPVPFALSLTLTVVLPILFFAFSGPFLWENLGGGGKATIFIFVYTCLIMWTSMVSMADA